MTDRDLIDRAVEAARKALGVSDADITDGETRILLAAFCREMDTLLEASSMADLGYALLEIRGQRHSFRTLAALLSAEGDGTSMAAQPALR